MNKQTGWKWIECPSVRLASVHSSASWGRGTRAVGGGIQGQAVPCQVSGSSQSGLSGTLWELLSGHAPLSPDL